MNAEFHFKASAAFKWLQPESMQGRSSRTGVDFSLNSLDVEIRQRQPFPPADDDFLLFHAVRPVIQKR